MLMRNLHDFPPQSPRAQELLDGVKSFMDEFVYPNEHILNAHQVRRRPCLPLAGPFFPVDWVLHVVCLPAL